MSNLNTLVLPEPVTWLIERSAFRVSPHGQDAESNEWLEEAHEPGEEGSFPVYTEQQVRALLATVTGKSGSNDSPLLAGVSAPAAQAAPAAQSVANADGRFTKNPVTIDAIKWTGSNLREVIAFTDGPPDTRSIHAGMAWEAYVDLVARDGLKIYTLEGKMLANIGDWIIRGIKGEYYPCKPDIFEATYTSAPQAQAVERDALTPAARDVLAERARQVSAEGWTPERDDQYTDCQLAAAAASYAVCGKDPKALKLMGVTAWPWRDYWWKPETYRRNLEKAGALILAEIERIDRQPSRA